MERKEEGGTPGIGQSRRKQGKREGEDPRAGAGVGVRQRFVKGNTDLR